MVKLPIVTVLALVLGIVSTRSALGQEGEDESERVFPIAILPFQERGREVKDLGAKVTDLLFAQLIAKPELYLVDRADLKTVLEEEAINLSGLVNPDEATKVGHLTGAKILVTGSVLQIDSTIYLIAKIIGTETSRVLGASVKGSLKDDADSLVNELAKNVSQTIVARAEHLVAAPTSKEDQIAALSKALGSAKRPTLLVKVAERHVGQPTLDPAAATEIMLFCTKSGFTVIDPDEGSRKGADVLIQGEAFSEFAARHGKLISVKARVELKAVDRVTGRVLAVDRQTSVAVDLAEQIAAKKALQEAAATVASRLLRHVVVRNED